MTVVTESRVATSGIDAIALKPSEVDLERAHDLPVSTLTIDYEGREHLPDPAALREFAESFHCRVTVPVRADGFDPLGDDSLWSSLPAGTGEVLVAGNSAYLSNEERRRAVAPRLREAQERVASPWVGTEGIERTAMAIGGTQFDLLSKTTISEVRSLRAAGFGGSVAVYAPTVLTEDPDAVLDAVGAYAARRRPIAAQLPADAPTDSTATGEARETLLSACREYALVGEPAQVEARIDALQDAGVDRVVSYPARGLDAILA
jgi:hypothetical protein